MKLYNHITQDIMVYFKMEILYKEFKSAQKNYEGQIIFKSLFLIPSYNVNKQVTNRVL